MQISHPSVMHLMVWTPMTSTLMRRRNTSEGEGEGGQKKGDFGRAPFFPMQMMVTCSWVIILATAM